MTATGTTPGQLFFANLDIDVHKIPIDKRTHYIALKYYLTVEDEPPPHATDLDKVHRYLEALHHLCQLQAWEQILLVLATPVDINQQTASLWLPLPDYLLYKGSFRKVLEISEDIIGCLPNTSNDLTPAIILKARALSAMGQLRDACHVFEEACAKSSENSETYIECTARLGMAQVQAGMYQEGQTNLAKSLKKIESLIEINPSPLSLNKILELKADILENIAYSEMNAYRFEKSINLYTEVINIRKEQGLIHKLAAPLVHQGIIMRRMGDCKRAINYLTEAKEVEIDKEIRGGWIDHHLAYVFLQEGNHILAEQYCKTSLEGYKKLEDQRGISDSYEQLGFINLAKGEIEDASKNFERGLNIRTSIGNLHGTASSLKDMAIVYWHQKRFIISLFYFFKSAALYFKIGVVNQRRIARLFQIYFVWTLGKRKGDV